jgi:acetyltransferase-like isoleucine patch superfamily enzyme
MLGSVVRLVDRWRLNRYKKRGLQIADDCRMEGMPFFGTEPYLISIGKHVLMSGKVAFFTHDGATWVFRDRPEFKDVVKYGRITIHDNCFIGYGSIILPGVSIGPNSVVAAGSVVTKDVPPGMVAGGVPAKVITDVETFAQKCKEACPPYDVERYWQDKRAVLLELMPYPW